jgi:hypothetical protein
MKVEEIIQRVVNLYSRGTPTDESRLTPRHVYSKLLSSRSKLLSQMAHKKQFISQWNYQVLDCVELVKAKPYECDCFDVGCSILRSKYQLPKPLTNLDRDLISSVSSIDGKMQFSEVQWNSLKYQKGNKYTNAKPYYILRNKYIFLFNIRGLKVISITGLFEDVTEAYNFPSFCPDKEEIVDCGDNILNMEFPIDNDKIDTVVEMAVNELVGVFSQMKEDRVNDSTELTINN